ncbi:hypothetical protein GCM10010156_70120 [Planobispora rosea]|uniref:Uncharacterized protein n=1 Tax=Planobispora rosea TaxID=35762 RepID=A0A8J3S9A8_PLARO|nr:hypothetical protein [Planobispora rosea]GGT02155.1 hypothetical protein GCM10010156_70120 [Planobispora rosea]GIH88437.1 hypothetical protein Pro02_68450 [Planobispora rosea]
MNALIGRAADLTLGLLAPRLRAEAAVIIGCCDFCLCRVKSETTGQTWCAGCSCTRC